MKQNLNPITLNNLEWQVLREALSDWRVRHSNQPEFKISACYSLEDKIDKVFIENMKGGKL